jgi:signal transduction histidine kinase
MTFLPTLRTRIVLGFVIFGLILSVTLAVAVYVGFHQIEDFIIKDAMRSEIAQMESASAKPRTSLPVMSLYSAPLGNLREIPAQLRTLEPGYHRIEIDNRQYAVLVEERGNQRYVASYDEAQIATRERYWLVGLAVGVVLALAISIWAGFSLAGQVIRPVRALTGDIQALESGREVGGELQGYANDEIGSLARAFQNYRDRFQALMEREKEFAGNVSHELRTPVTSINLAAEVLAQDPTMSEKQRFRLRRIRRAGQEMSEMINTFLLLSRHEDESGEDLTDCDVNRAVREIAETQGVWIGDKPVSVKIVEEGQLTVPAPHGVIAVLIGNVVRNAYRYTSQGIVTIRITGDRVIIEDTGPGIDDHTQEHLFDRHVHGQSSDHGSGLGLSIVKRLCERFGWQVEVKSTLGSGSRFDIILRPA